MNLPDTPEIYEELLSVLRHFDACHRNAEDARRDHAAAEAEVNEIRRSYMDAIYTDPQGKVKWSNQERREAEAQRRIEEHWPDLIDREAHTRTRRLEFAAELERSTEALKTYRILAALVEAEVRRETVAVDVASMPRMVRR